MIPVTIKSTASIENIVCVNNYNGWYTESSHSLCDLNKKDTIEIKPSLWNLLKSFDTTDEEVDEVIEDV